MHQYIHQDNFVVKFCIYINIYRLYENIIYLLLSNQIVISLFLPKQKYSRYAKQPYVVHQTARYTASICNVNERGDRIQ